MEILITVIGILMSIMMILIGLVGLELLGIFDNYSVIQKNIRKIARFINNCPHDNRLPKHLEPVYDSVGAMIDLGFYALLLFGLNQILMDIQQNNITTQAIILIATYFTLLTILTYNILHFIVHKKV